MQIMAIGGNGRARQFFKQHGWDELGADKIESKVIKRFHV
jgi:ADP-ribosylation factor GTPase-activating protein 2/3